MPLYRASNRPIDRCSGRSRSRSKCVRLIRSPLLDVVGLQPGVSRQPLCGLPPLVVAQPVAAREDHGVLAIHPPLDLLEQSRQVELLQVGRQLLVVPGRRRVRGDVVQVRQVVVGAEEDPLEVQRARHQDHAGQRDAAVDQVPGQSGGAGRPVALADDVQGRGPSVVPRQVHPDELADRLDVAAQRVEPGVELGLGRAEYPVPTGSMKTRSARSSQVASLSTSLKGGAGIVGSSGAATRRGPGPHMQPDRR